MIHVSDTTILVIPFSRIRASTWYLMHIRGFMCQILHLIGVRVLVPRQHALIASFFDDCVVIRIRH